MGISNGCADATACPGSFSAGELLVPTRVIEMDGIANDRHQSTDENRAGTSPPHPLSQKIGCCPLEIHSAFRQKPPEACSE